MLILQLSRGTLKNGAQAKFNEFLASVPGHLKALVRQTVQFQANALNVPPEVLNTLGPATTVSRWRSASFGRRAVEMGEILTDGVSFYIVEVDRKNHITRFRDDEEDIESETELNYSLRIAYVGPHFNDPTLEELLRIAERVFETKVSFYRYSSEKFDDLKKESTRPFTAPSEEELAGARVLADKTTRILAIAIKSSGGLLLRDLGRQLPTEAADRTVDIPDKLKSAGLVDSEIVIVCAKTQAQTARVPSRETVEVLSAQGLKCACGRPIAQEKIEEALTMTDLGRQLIDGSRWLSFLLYEQLKSVGLRDEDMLFEQQASGDELDCLANISGELVLFELKDKEFNLGSAYSFGAKIGIIRPDHSVIVSTASVGNDAKEHFQKAGLARTGQATTRRLLDDDDEESRSLRYIEGIDQLSVGVKDLAGEIYESDAASIMDKVVPLAVPQARALLIAIQRPRVESDTTQL